MQASSSRAWLVVLCLLVVAGCAKGSKGIGNGGSGGAATGAGQGGASTAIGSTASSASTASMTTTTGNGTGGAGSTSGSGSGSSTSSGMMGRPLGDPCNVDSDCASNLCKPVVLNTPPVCVTPCTQQSDCGTSPTYFCEPITAGSTNGYCIPQSPAHCLSCTQNSDCGSLSETCFQAPGDNTMACHVDCAIAGQAACPNDYHCVAETVNGQARQLCRPKIIPTCLDAIGGFCDRLSIPQDCIRTNTAGTCIGQRQCLSASKRFDKCGASSPQYKPDCSTQDPAGCMESYAPAATSGVTNCGMCGHVCPGYQQIGDNVTCNASQMCTFSCQGENYDVDGNQANGCEVADSPTGNHTQSTPANEGTVACYDGNGHTVHFSGQLPSDARVHENPSVTGFDAASGSAPDWYSIFCSGQSSIFNPCANDVVLTLTVQGSSSPTCYHFHVHTNKNDYDCDTNASGVCGFNSSTGQYTDGSTMLLEVYKTCGTNVLENVSYIIDGHL